MVLVERSEDILALVGTHRRRLSPICILRSPFLLGIYRHALACLAVNIGEFVFVKAGLTRGAEKAKEAWGTGRAPDGPVLAVLNRCPTEAALENGCESKSVSHSCIGRGIIPVEKVVFDSASRSSSTSCLGSVTTICSKGTVTPDSSSSKDYRATGPASSP